MTSTFFALSGIISGILVVIWLFVFIFCLINCEVWIISIDNIETLMWVSSLVVWGVLILYWLCVGFACAFDEVLHLGLRY